MVSEADFLRQVTDLAAILGWSYVHFRPAQTSRGWRTPVQGPLGKGWPDLTLVRARDRRLIFAELKREGQDVTADQEAVLEQLLALEVATDSACGELATSIQVWVWRPSDFDRIAEVLR